jgi:hypothetical protein
MLHGFILGSVPRVIARKFIARFHVNSNTTRERPALCHMTAPSFVKVATLLSWAFNPKAEQDKLIVIGRYLLRAFNVLHL